MKLRDLGEFGFIQRILPGCRTQGSRIVRGIGDDCAVIRLDPQRLQLVTTDLLLETIHFRRQWMTPQQLGAKALTVNLSDIAAMGGEPLDAYVSLAAPGDTAVEFLEQLYQGLTEQANRFQVNLLGGDTSSSSGDVVINILVTGQVDPQEVLFRDGAHPGDRLFVTGCLGDSAAGLHLLSQPPVRKSAWDQALIQRHLCPLPHLSLGRAIGHSRAAHAMMDLSDGLWSDLPHMCRASGVGAEVYVHQLPVSGELKHWAAQEGRDSLEIAALGGEDYVLLVAGPPDLPSRVGQEGQALHEIGAVVSASDPKVRYLDAQGKDCSFQGRGWEHFAPEKAP